MKHENEANLIRSFCQTGDPELFGRLIGPYEMQMHSVSRSILRHEADAMDAVQDAVLRAFQNMDSLADPGRFGGWLMRIVFGCSIDRLRSRNAGVERNREAPFKEPACQRLEPHDRLDAQEWSARISQAIKSLPPRYRQPLLLFHLNGLSTGQVAQYLDIPQGTARSLLTRARKQLAEQLPAEMKEVPVLANDLFHEQASAQGLLSKGAGDQLHVMNGDAAADCLRASGLVDAVVVCTDLLHEGPTLADVSPEQWRRARAEHLSSMGFVSVSQIEARMEQADEELVNPGDGRDWVFWFEHDLYDQLLLIRHLHWLSLHDVGVTQSMSLICIGSFPGIDRFIGLGQLEPDQIVSLLETSQPINQEQVDLGSMVWQDFCHNDPRKLFGWLTADTSALPYLQDAIRRHFQQYPSVANGLGRTEQQVLEIIRDHPRRACEVFTANQSCEASPFLGDAVVYHYIDRLTKERTPALRTISQCARVTAETEVALTDFGQKLLAGEADRVQTNGIDRWFGGVRLMGHNTVWRWDERLQQIVWG